MKGRHGLGRQLLDISTRDLFGELGPDLSAVLRSEIKAGELAAALSFDAGAVLHGDAGTPAVHRLPTFAEAAGQPGLKAGPVEKGSPVVRVHPISLPEVDNECQVQSDLRFYADVRSTHTHPMVTRKSFGFGARLRMARELKGMSGTELGKGAGENGKDASRASVSDWENDHHYPKADQLRVLCLKLGVSADDLLFGDLKEELKVIQAKAAIRELSEEQRAALLAQMAADRIYDPGSRRSAPEKKVSKKGALK